MSNGQSGTLVVPTDEAGEDGRGQQVPEDLQVVCPHLLLSFLLGRPPLVWLNFNLARSLWGEVSRRHELGVTFGSGTFVPDCPGRSEE